MEGNDFAVLISAPWGSGKTHLVRGWLEDTETDAISVSLFGAKGRDDVEAALLMELLSKQTGDFAEQALGLGRAALKLLPNKADEIVGDALKKGALKHLPSILVFDDFERANMPKTELLGVINEFVERAGKRVVLLANEDHLWEGETPLQKEKVIGATLPVEADIEAVLPGLISRLESEFAKFLRRNEDTVKKVFTIADHHNLRSLSQSLWEFQRLFQVLDTDLKGNETAVRELLEVYVALSLELKAGELSVCDLTLRRRVDLGDNPEFESLRKAGAKYGDDKIRYGEHMSVLPSGLDIELLIHGKVDPERVNTRLRATPQFKPEKEKRDWEELYRVRKLEPDDAQKAFDAVHRRFEHHIYEHPGEVLHVFHAMLLSSERGLSGVSVEEMKENCLAYLEQLHSDDKIVPANPSARRGLLDESAYGYSDHGCLGYSFPQHHSDVSTAFQDLFYDMRKAQDEALKATFPKVREQLLEMMKLDSSEFDRLLASRGMCGGEGEDYSLEPVLAGANSEEWAQALLDLSPEQLDSVLGVFKERHDHRRIELIDEFPWFKALRDEMLNQVSTESDFRKWQVDSFLNSGLSQILAWNAEED